MVARLGPKKQFVIVAKETPWTGLERAADPIASALPYGTKLSATGLFTWSVHVVL
jgi:hypothetical protein